MKKKEHKSKSLLCRICLFLLSFAFSTIVQAQNITVTGSVEDQNGEPLIGVSVAELNTANGTNYRILTVTFPLNVPRERPSNSAT